MDGPNAIHMSAAVLDRWEERLHDIFYGRPYDMLDAALTDTIYKFPMDIKVQIEDQGLVYAMLMFRVFYNYNKITISLA